ncbi:streptophobe family protein [Streptomyces sp. NPDC050263]|uniref:streptophobe family protein n=1 Tax=Streptomyces sp. NPDC050263 TaxID=3155037 RepID=UPI00343DDADC
MAGTAALGLHLLGADSVGSLGPMTAAAVALGAGGSVTPSGDVSAFGLTGAEANTAIEITPLGVSLVGALLLSWLFLRSLRGAGVVIAPAELVARVGAVVALFVAMLGGLAWAGHDVITLDGGSLGLDDLPGGGSGGGGGLEIPGLGDVGDIGGLLPDRLGDLVDAKAAVGFTVDTVPTLLGGIGWSLGILLIALLASRRTPLPRGWEAVHRVVGPAVSAVVTVLLVAVAAGFAAAAYAAIGDDHPKRIAGAALLGAPNGVWLGIPIGLFVPWDGQATGALKNLLPDPLDDLLGAGTEQPVTLSRLAELDERVWLLGVAAALMMLLAGVLTAVRTPVGAPAGATGSAGAAGPSGVDEAEGSAWPGRDPGRADVRTGRGPGGGYGRGTGEGQAQDPGDAYGQGHGQRPGERHGRGPGDEYGRGPGQGQARGTGAAHGQAPGQGHGQQPGERHGRGPGDRYGQGPGEEHARGTGEAYGRRSDEAYVQGTGEGYRHRPGEGASGAEGAGGRGASVAGFAGRCAVRLGIATALALPLIAWLTEVSVDASLSVLGFDAFGAGIELRGQLGMALLLGALWGAGAGAAGALLACATGAAGQRAASSARGDAGGTAVDDSGEGRLSFGDSGEQSGPYAPSASYRPPNPATNPYLRLPEELLDAEDARPGPSQSSRAGQSRSYESSRRDESPAPGGRPPRVPPGPDDVYGAPTVVRPIGPPPRSPRRPADPRPGERRPPSGPEEGPPPPPPAAPPPPRAPRGPKGSR